MRRFPQDERGCELLPPPVAPQPGKRTVGAATVEFVEEVREYELITPLFGGGVTPGSSDEVTTIRGTEIRGQFRFWWRATRGGLSGGNLDRMREMEGMIWGRVGGGAVRTPSQVDIAVEVTKGGREKKVFTSRNSRTSVLDEWRKLSYLLWPLQPQDDRPAGKLHDEVAFKLHIRFPADLREDVDAALWAWETFGGIGARTRRGFGAVKLVAVNGVKADLPYAPDAQEWILEGLRRHIVAKGTNGGLAWPGGVPHLSRSPRMKVTRPLETPRKAWEVLIDRLRAFRQSRGRGGSRGRSDWPEAEAVREIVFGRRRNAGAPFVKKFPRAAFGLPIEFHLRGETDAELVPESGYNRLASPLILRPLACREGAVGVALILDGTSLPPGNLILKCEKTQCPVEANLTPQEARHIRPLRGKKNPTDVLGAFLESL